MILGVLSDTHGQAARARSAVALLKRLGAEALVHCGDVGGEAVFDALAGQRCWFVWGNTDAATRNSASYAESLGITAPHDVPLHLALSERVIAVFHGHEHAFATVAQLAQRGDEAQLKAATSGAAYVLYGHTHIAAVERIAGTTFVNPGALHRARTYTVATIDLVTDSVEHWIVSDDFDPLARPRRFRLD